MEAGQNYVFTILGLCWYVQFIQLWFQIVSLERFLNEKNAVAVDDRRHIANSGNLAMAFSNHDLYDQIKEKFENERREAHPIVNVSSSSAASAPVQLLPEWETPCPSYFAKQFLPPSIHKHTSENYTGTFFMGYIFDDFLAGRFMIRLVCQSRTLRKQHVDMHWCNVIFKYIKEFAVKYKPYVSFNSMDDKAAIKIGNPFDPVTAVPALRRVPAIVVPPSDDSGIPQHHLLALDHDFGIFCDIFYL